MKDFQYYLLILLTGSLIFSCSNEVEKSISINDIKSSLSEITQTSLDGNFVVKNSSENEIVTLILSNNNLQSHVLQTNDSNIYDFGEITAAFRSEKSLILYSESEQTIYSLGISFRELSKINEALSVFPLTIYEIEGYGLSSNNSLPQIDVNQLKEKSFFDIIGVNDPRAFGDDDCNSGGEGSSSCEIGGSLGCSVECREGYYACCNPAGFTYPSSCKCVEEGLEPPGDT